MFKAFLAIIGQSHLMLIQNELVNSLECFKIKSRLLESKMSSSSSFKVKSNGFKWIFLFESYHINIIIYLKFGGTQKCRGTVVENHWHTATKSRK